MVLDDNPVLGLLRLPPITSQAAVRQSLEERGVRDELKAKLNCPGDISICKTAGCAGIVARLAFDVKCGLISLEPKLAAAQLLKQDIPFLHSPATSPVRRAPR